MIQMIGLRNIPSSIAKDAGELESLCRAAPRKLSIPAERSRSSKKCGLKSKSSLWVKRSSDTVSWVL